MRRIQSGEGGFFLFKVDIARARREGNGRCSQYMYTGTTSTTVTVLLTCKKLKMPLVGEWRFTMILSRADFGLD